MLGRNFWKLFLITIKVIKGKSDSPVFKTHVIGKLQGVPVDKRSIQVRLLGFL